MSARAFTSSARALSRGACGLLGVAGLPCQAGAAGAIVEVACGQLSAEQAAEVEARVRATLLALRLQASVTLQCTEDLVGVRAVSQSGTATVEARTTNATLKDDALGAVEQALGELSRPAAERAPEQASDDAASSLPAPQTPAAREPTPRPTAPAPQGPDESAPPPRHSTGRGEPASTRFFVRVAGERWSDHVALGADLGATRGPRWLWAGFSAGGVRAFGTRPVFDASEWHACFELGTSPAWAAGVQAVLGLGASALIVAPQGYLESRDGVVAGAVFLQAVVSRPVWFGRWALAPALAARLFGSKRGVKVDEREHLVLGGLTPQLQLGVLYDY
ncbi:MAG TPA: hypothetical protein VJN18_20460 [Polyangiaceae bacterium]|nr:hypothetical protein [Polyangiaceae bacterium]